MEKGHPNVPVEWMKDQWKKHGLKASIQLTISGCLGPCDLSNVASVCSAERSVWLGRLREFANYAALLEWALASREAGQALPLPGELSELQFDPFRRTDSVPVTPAAEIVESVAGSS
jgi:cobaltochelatase CobN